MKAIFLGLPASAEQELLDNGEDFNYVRRLAMHEGEVCEVTLSIDAGDEFEDNYYDLRFADGFRFYDCSGLHLEELK